MRTDMYFERILDNNTLWAVRYDEDEENALDMIFRPLENSRSREILFGKEKAKLMCRPEHPSWLRLYAIKLEPGCYIITGGAIKLTRTMEERQHKLPC